MEGKLYDDEGQELPNWITYSVSYTYDIEEVMQILRDTMAKIQNVRDEIKVCEADIYALVEKWAEEDTKHKPKHLNATYIYSDREETN